MNNYSHESENQNTHKMQINEILKKLFPDIDIVMEKVNYGGSISVFIVSILNVDELEKTWNEVSNSIAAYYQVHLISDFDKWNIYIIYKCYDKIDISLMYKIENDKFSSRKIVHIIKKEENDDLLNNLLITNYITNKDLELSIKNNTHTIKGYKSDSEIWEFVNKGRIKINRNSNKEVESVLEQIEIKFQYEN